MELNDLTLLREYLGWVVKSYGSYELGGRTGGKINPPSIVFNKMYPYINQPDDDLDEESEEDQEHPDTDESNVSRY